MKDKLSFLLLLLFIYCDASPIGNAKKETNQKVDYFSVNSITTKSARIDWFCSDSVIGTVVYGKNQFESSITSIRPAKVHSMTLSNLEQNTQYNYKVFCGKPDKFNFLLLINQTFRTLKEPDPIIPPPPIPPLLSSEQIKRGIWILGGTDNSGNPIAQVDFFDPVDNKWFSDVTRIPTPRRYAGIVNNNGKIYVLGGMVGVSTVNTVEELTLGDTFTWRTMNSMPVNLQGFVVATNNNESYLIGGSTTNNIQIGTLPAFSIYRFQPLIGSNGSWATITIATALLPHIDLSGCIIDGTFLFGGGRFFFDGTSQNLHNGYVVGSNTTTTISEANFTYSAHGTASVCYRPIPSDPFPSDTKSMFVLGGSTLTDLSQPVVAITPTNQYNYYQPLTNTMSSGPVLPIALYYPTAEISYELRRLYVFGGANLVNVPRASVYSMPLSNPTGGPWQTELDMPRARFGHKAIILSR
ncbi:MAG: hypothetical protein SFU98_10915 [Leptospiraceae bacterium]|nr:hypothetical protein [Leptospiraceae bacterium]